jgi:phosphoglycolate phosphatase
MYSRSQLVILDADGTTVDAFSAIQKAFAYHNMDIGDLARFQKRRHLFKYIGGLKEFPKNLKNQSSKQKRKELIDTLTQVYREEANLYPGIAELMNALLAAPHVIVGVVTRNITNNARETLSILFRRHAIDVNKFDFFLDLPLKEQKSEHFRMLREHFDINPACAYACGDEKTDYFAAIHAGMHPFMVSYGFEDYTRLTGKLGLPSAIISRTPNELKARVLHALGMSFNRGKTTDDKSHSPAWYAARQHPRIVGIDHRVHRDLPIAEWC